MQQWDLRAFIQTIEEAGELRRIRVQVSSQLEIAAITNKVSKQKTSPALWFENISGCPIPMVTNLFGSISRVELALRTHSLEELRNRLFRDLQFDKNDTLANRFKLLLSRTAHQPVLVEHPLCQEIIENNNPNLFTIPVVKSWPEDGGSYITLPMIFTRSPFSDDNNCGMYRVQIFDEKTLGIRWGESSDARRHYKQWQAQGKPMPVAIALGGEPAMTYAAGFPLPKGVNETVFAGYLQQRSIVVAKCISNDLCVPALAEIIIEGFADPKSTKIEGPFGNHTGYYADEAEVPLVHVTAITHRYDAIYPATVVGPPPMEDCYLAKATERLLLAMLQTEFPNIDDINFPLEGIFHGCALLKLKEGAEGTGADLLRSLWQKSLLKKSRLLIVYKNGVDIANPSEAYWHAINCAQFERDFIINGSRLGIDVSQPDNRIPVKPDPEILKKIGQRWSEYGLD